MLPVLHLNYKGNVYFTSTLREHLGCDSVAIKKQGRERKKIVRKRRQKEVGQLKVVEKKQIEKQIFYNTVKLDNNSAH